MKIPRGKYTLYTHHGDFNVMLGRRRTRRQYLTPTRTVTPDWDKKINSPESPSVEFRQKSPESSNIRDKEILLVNVSFFLPTLFPFPYPTVDPRTKSSDVPITRNKLSEVCRIPSLIFRIDL